MPQTAAAHALEGGAAQYGGGEHSATIYIAGGGPGDAAMARDVATVIYFADRPGDMEVWLFERLMDRYSHAFDISDAWNDPILQKAINSERVSIRARLKRVADHHAPIIFQAGVNYFTRNYSSDALRSMLIFCRSEAGKKYFYWANIPYLDDRAVIGLLADNSKLADDIISELRSVAPDAMSRHPELARALTIAGGALR